MFSYSSTKILRDAELLILGYWHVHMATLQAQQLFTGSVSCSSWYQLLPFQESLFNGMHSLYTVLGFVKTPSFKYTMHSGCTHSTPVSSPWSFLVTLLHSVTDCIFKWVLELKCVLIHFSISYPIHQTAPEPYGAHPEPRAAFAYQTTHPTLWPGTVFWSVTGTASPAAWLRTWALLSKDQEQSLANPLQTSHQQIESSKPS